MPTAEKRSSVMDCVRQFVELNQTARSKEEYVAGLEPLLRTETFCPSCSATFIFDDTLKCNDADQSYEFFCPRCGVRYTGLKTAP